MNFLASLFCHVVNSSGYDLSKGVRKKCVFDELIDFSEIRIRSAKAPRGLIDEPFMTCVKKVDSHVKNLSMGCHAIPTRFNNIDE